MSITYDSFCITFLQVKFHTFNMRNEFYLNVPMVMEIEFLFCSESRLLF